MVYEVGRNFPLKNVTIETPIYTICKTVQKELAFACDIIIIIVSILYAGLGMVNGLRDIIPTAKVRYIGLFKDEKILESHEYNVKFPDSISDLTKITLVIDPMLATGGSVIVAINKGLETLSKAQPDVDIFAATKDEKLNEKVYIVPGLAYCGDRLFGTTK